MAGLIEAKLAELGITLPQPMPPIATYVPYVITGDLVVVSGQVPAVDGKVSVTGKLGDRVSMEDGHAPPTAASSTCSRISRWPSAAISTGSAAWCVSAASSPAPPVSPTRRGS